MTAFAGKFVHQTSRFVMRHTSRFAAALAEHRPFVFCKFARHAYVQQTEVCRTSLPFEFWLSFFKKRGHAFVLVCAREAEREEIDFAAQAFVQV